MKKRKISSWEWKKFSVTLAAIIACIYYAWLRKFQLDPTATLYIGLPAVLALIITLMPRSQSILSASMKALTVFLLLSMILFSEGFICVIMAAPIFYAITGMIACIIDLIIKRYKNKRETKLHSSAVLILAALLSLEGTHESLTFNRNQEVQTEKIVNASPVQIISALEYNKDFSKPTHILTKLFPKPYKIEGTGLEIGDKREVFFSYKKLIFFNEHKGSLVYKIDRLDNNHISYKIIKDTSYISHYLNWTYSQVSWEQVDTNKTKVTWKLGYERKLDPAWYFIPLKYFYTTLTAETLIDNFATPKNI